jgi:signal transduction histidine kinase
MEERVRRLGGTFTIESAPGKGATVKAELPLHKADSP